MTLSTAFQTKQNTRVWILDEATMGTTDATEEYIEMPITDYSFDDIHKHTLSVAPPRTGSGAFTQSDDMVKWQRHDRMYDISITFHATAQSINRVCKALFGDGDGTNTLIGSMPSVTDFRDGQSNSVPVSIIFENAAHAGSGNDAVFTSCVCTGLTLSGDIASNGGVVMLVTSNLTPTGSTPLGTFNPSYTISDGTNQMVFQTFTSASNSGFDGTGGTGGTGGISGSAGELGTSAGDGVKGSNGYDGREGVAAVIFV